MSSVIATTARPSNVNIPLIGLLAASVVVGVAGYLYQAKSNADEAAIYASGTADYPKLFAAQSGSTVGGLLIAVGVLGLLLALATLAVTRRPQTVATVTDTTTADELDDFEAPEPDDLADELVSTGVAPGSDAPTDAAKEPAARA